VTAITSDSFTVTATHKSSNWSGTVTAICTVFSFETPQSV
jgi:hypothetical protein